MGIEQKFTPEEERKIKLHYANIKLAVAKTAMDYTGKNDFFGMIIGYFTFKYLDKLTGGRDACM